MDKVNYNNLEDIDKLIEKLERELPSSISSNSKVNKAIEIKTINAFLKHLLNCSTLHPLSLANILRIYTVIVPHNICFFNHFMI